MQVRSYSKNMKSYDSGIAEFSCVSSKKPLTCQADRSTWEVLLYRVLQRVITVLMGHESLFEQPK